MTDAEIKSMSHFLQLARRGKFPAASSGERRAYQLGKKILALGDLLMGLDADAEDGFYHALRAAANPDARDIVDKHLPR